MKKLTLIALLVTLSTPALANFTGPNAVNTNTVQGALNARDEAPVVLTGNITQALGNEIYMFKDATGEIRIEIDAEDFHQQTVSPQDTVTIHGEVDNEWTHKKVDVDFIQKK